MSDPVSWKREKLSKKILADVDALGAIDDDTLAAIQKLNNEEAALMQRILNGEICEDDHFVLWTVDGTSETNAPRRANRTSEDHEDDH